MTSSHILGIDVGSVSIHIVVLNTDAHIVHTDTSYHHGEVKQCLSKLIGTLNLSRVHYVAATFPTGRLNPCLGPRTS